ncbi:hypothetical protein Tco_0555457 [Tanacetum coccineum]
MERGFLSYKGSGVGRGVKEKQVLMADKSVMISKHVNLALGSNSATQTHNVVNAGLESFPTVSEAHGIHAPASTNEVNMNDVDTVNNVANNGTMMGPTPVGNTPGRSISYANVSGEPSRKALNFRTLFTPDGNEVNVAVPVESFRAISEQFANTTYGVNTLGMERGFLSQKGSRVERGVKEKQVLMANKSFEVSKHVNVALGTNSATRTHNVVNKGLESFPTVSEAHGTHTPASANEVNMNDAGTVNKVANNGTSVGPTSAGNTPGRSTLYANVIGEPSRKALNFHLGSSYTRALIEIRADVELKDNIDKCPKNIDSGVANNLKKPSQTLRGVLVGCKVAFCLLEDLTAFCLKISLRFASRPHCVLLQDLHCVLLEDLTAFCLKTSLRFASRPHCVLLQGKENGVNILKSIDEGPFHMGTFRETLAEGYEDNDRYNADIRATNIILQGLPKDIYSLINHYTDAKDIWDRVKMLMEGSKLTKEDCESQLYDDFEHFRQHKGETIHDYYLRFAKLINDMHNIKMTMSRMQLNSKFVNNMLPEWGRFVTAVKLNRGLRDSNYDQLYAYLKQHEAHANEKKMMLDRFTQHIVDPPALMTIVSHQQYNSQSSTNPSSTYVSSHFADNSQLDSGLSPTDNLIENLTNTLALLT